VTVVAPDGRLVGCVSYQAGPGGLHVRWVAAAFNAKVGFDVPDFAFTFRNRTTGAVDYRFTSPIVDQNAVRSHSTGRILIGHRPGARAIHRGDVLEVTLRYENNQGLVRPVAALSVSLNRHGLLCPSLGNDPETSNGGPVC
jgi:hypothetical protein